MPSRSKVHRVVVVTRPAGVLGGLAAGGEVADDVAVGIEETHRGYGNVGPASLAAALAQQVGGLEDRGLVVGLGAQ